MTIAIKSNFKLHIGKIVYAPKKGPTEMIALAILEEDYNSNYVKIQIIKEFLIEIKGATYCDLNFAFHYAKKVGTEF